MPSQRLFAPRYAALLVSLLASTVARAATPAEVDAAIEKAKAFIYSKQQPTGLWERATHREGLGHDWGQMQGDTFGGYTSIATYALLAAGESHQDPRIAKAVAA